MRLRFLAAIAVLCIGGCASWHPIAFQNQSAFALDNTLYRDISTLVTSSIEGVQDTIGGIPTQVKAPYYSPLYGTLQADITNCRVAYGLVTQEGISVTQLDLLADALQQFKTQDSSGAPLSWFQANGPNLLDIAKQIDTVEARKLIQ